MILWIFFQTVNDDYCLGIYDSCFGVNLLSELIECGLVSLLRSCMDEKEESLIYSGTECLANLIAPQVFMEKIIL